MTEQTRKRGRQRLVLPHFDSLAGVEANHIALVYAATGRNLKHASEILGVDRKTLRTKLERQGLIAASGAER